MSKIQFFFEDIQPFKFNKKYFKKHIENLINEENDEVGDILVIFCSDEYLLEINEQYLNHNYYTDIITFDYVEDSLISGDLFISVDRVKDNAIKFSKDFKNELYRVVFHGVLHLIGFKDKSENDKKLMRYREDFYLQKVDFSEEEI